MKWNRSSSVHFLRVAYGSYLWPRAEIQFRSEDGPGRPRNRCGATAISEKYRAYEAMVSHFHDTQNLSTALRDAVVISALRVWEMPIYLPKGEHVNFWNNSGRLYLSGFNRHDEDFQKTRKIIRSTKWNFIAGAFKSIWTLRGRSMLEGQINITTSISSIFDDDLLT